MLEHAAPTPEPEEPLLPSNLEAEQSILGAIMVNNDAYAKVQDFLEPAHFYEPLHAEIFQACQSLIEKGKVAQPTTVKPFVEKHDGLAQVGGNRYLARLCTAAVTVLHAEDYGRAVYDAFVRRQLVEIGEDMAYIAARPKVDQSAEKMLEEFEGRLAGVRGIAASERTVWSIGEALESTIEAHDRLQSGDDLSLIRLGIKCLDDKLGGVTRGEYNVIGGRPGMGKSAVACVIAYEVAARGHNVGLSSPDMGRGAVAARLASYWLAKERGQMVPYENILKGRLDRMDRSYVQEALAALRQLSIMIDDRANPTVAMIASRAREWDRKCKANGGRLDLHLVDHIHNLRASHTLRGKGRTEQVGEISNDLKAMARDQDIPLLAFAQLSRPDKQAEVRRPGLDDLRWAGEIEQDVRWAVFLHRPWYYKADKKPDPKDIGKLADWEDERAAHEYLIEFNIAKQNNGPTGVVTSYCDLPVNLISETRPGR